MREIKFRLWNPDERKMMSGVNQYGAIEPDYRCIGPSSSGAFTRLWESLRRIKESDFKLMQYTGLKDINGVEIYEGDICKRQERNYEVMHDVNSGSVRLGKVRQGGPRLTALQAGNIKVIGNIHENPELLNP